MLCWLFVQGVFIVSFTERMSMMKFFCQSLMITDNLRACLTC